MRRALFIFAALFTWCDFIHADHRSALVIANHNYAAAELKLDAPDLKAVVARLERHGFQCTVKSNLDNNQLKRAIEDLHAHPGTWYRACLFHRASCSGRISG